MLNDDVLAMKKFKAIEAFLKYKTQSDSLVRNVFHEP